MSEDRYPQVQAFLLCETQIVDKRDRISLINIFNNIHAKQTPINTRFWVFFRIVLPPGDFGIQLTVEDSDDEVIEKGQLLEIEPENEHIQHHFQGFALEFPEFSTYYVKAYLNGDEVSAVPVNCIPIKAE